jgi:hypothetical protein
MKTYITTYNQTIFDVCIATYGTLNYLGKLMDDNSLAITDYIPVGSSILYDSSFTPNSVTFTSGILDGSYCGIVSGFGIGNFTTTVGVGGIVTGGCTITWQPTQYATKYIYQLNTTGIPPTTFSGTNLLTPQVVLTGLKINTNYFIYVATICTNGSTSNWTSLEFIVAPTLFPSLYYTEAGYILSDYFANE